MVYNELALMFGIQHGLCKTDPVIIPVSHASPVYPSTHAQVYGVGYELSVQVPPLSHAPCGQPTAATTAEKNAIVIGKN